MSPLSSSTPSVVRLADRLQASLPDHDPNAPFDLSNGDVVIPVDDRRIDAALGRLDGSAEELVTAARDALAETCNRPPVIELTADAVTALQTAVAACRSQTGRERVLIVDNPTSAARQLDGDVGIVAADDLEAALQKAPCAAVVCRPISDRETPEAAWASSAHVIIDESESAFRRWPTTGTAARDLSPDFVIIGSTAACGYPFGATLGFAGAPKVESTAPVSPLSAAIASVALPILREGSAQSELDAIGEALRATFADACRDESLCAELQGPGRAMEFYFAGQENAEAPLLAHHFQLELQALGYRADKLLLPHLGMRGRVLDRARRALAAAVARMRVLLIEHNSYLSGSLGWPFGDAPAPFADRGLAIYRYTKQSAVDVTNDGDGIRIKLWPEKMECTSSGFYAPTTIRGDFDLRIRYRLVNWNPGPKVACLALFTQNLPSTARYYAQRITTSGIDGLQGVTRGTPHDLLHEPRTEGWLRLTREGAHVRCWERAVDADEWTLMASEPDGSTDDVIPGAKIWSEDENHGLEAVLTDFEVDATPLPDQEPPIEPRIDPRSASRGGPDRYSHETRHWLDLRFDLPTLKELGIELGPYQPLGGLGPGAWNGSTLLMAARWVRTVALLRGMKAESFLDVGGAEGMVAAMMHARTGVEAVSCDLSHQASLQADEVFGVPALAGEAHRLPFADDSFDVVYLGEVVEHLAQPVRTLMELRRIAKRAVIVTTEAYARSEAERQEELDERDYEPHMDRSILCPGDFDVVFDGYTVSNACQIAHLPEDMPQARGMLDSCVLDVVSNDSLDHPSLGIFVLATKSGGDAELVRPTMDDVRDVLDFAAPQERQAPATPADAPIPEALVSRLVDPMTGNPLSDADCRARYPVERGVPDLLTPLWTNNEPLESRLRRELPQQADSLLELDGKLTFDLPPASGAAAFFSDGQAHGWTPSEGVTIVAGTTDIRIDASATDPYLRSPRLDRPIAQARKITLELATTSRDGRNTEAVQVFAHTLRRPLFCEALSSRAEYAADGSWQTVEVTLPANLADDDDLLWLRIDPADEAAEVKVRRLTLGAI